MLAAALGFYLAELIHPSNSDRAMLLALVLTFVFLIVLLFAAALTGLLV